MAMDKITDEQLMALLRQDMDTSDPAGVAYGMQRSQPIFDDLADYPADEIAEMVRDYEEKERAMNRGQFDPRLDL